MNGVGVWNLRYGGVNEVRAMKTDETTTLEGYHHSFRQCASVSVFASAISLLNVHHCRVILVAQAKFRPGWMSSGARP